MWQVFGREPLLLLLFLLLFLLLQRNDPHRSTSCFFIKAFSSRRRSVVVCLLLPGVDEEGALKALFESAHGVVDHELTKQQESETTQGLELKITRAMSVDSLGVNVTCYPPVLNQLKSCPSIEWKYTAWSLKDARFVATAVIGKAETTGAAKTQPQRCKMLSVRCECYCGRCMTLITMAMGTTTYVPSLATPSPCTTTPLYDSLAVVTRSLRAVAFGVGRAWRARAGATVRGLVRSADEQDKVLEVDDAAVVAAHDAGHLGHLLTVVEHWQAELEQTQIRTTT